MLFLITYLSLGLYTLYDASKRDERTVWKVLIFVIGPVIFPFYLSNRKLIQGEIRIGGKTWNICKNILICMWIYYAVFIALFIVVPPDFGFYKRLLMIEGEPTAETAELIEGSLILNEYFLLIEIAICIILTIILLIIGFTFKNKSITEHGPE